MFSSSSKTFEDLTVSYQCILESLRLLIDSYSLLKEKPD